MELSHYFLCVSYYVTFIIFFSYCRTEANYELSSVVIGLTVVFLSVAPPPIILTV